MREIKFRGKRKSDGDLFYGDLVTETNGNFEVKRAFIHLRLSEINFTEDSLTSRVVIHEVEPESVGQYTGLKDKNSEEIYEGDIVVVDNGSYSGTVKFNEEDLSYVIENETGGFGFVNGQTYDERPEFRTYEVVGNIYKNTEILK